MTESTAVLGAERNLIATFSKAAEGGADGLCLLLTNSGVIPRAGPHRMNVHLSRHFAKLSISSVRFDMSGLGDSRRASGRLGTLDQWVSDTQATMDEAQVRLGANRFLMIGFCSGAEVAHLTALRDPRLCGLVLWDSFTYPTLQSRMRSLLHRVRRRGASGVLRAVARIVQLRLLRVGDAAAPEGRMWQGAPDPVPSLQEYSARLRTLSDRNVRILVVHSGGEPLSYNHRSQFLQTIGRDGLNQKLDFSYLDKADHLLTRADAQQEFVHTVSAWVLRSRFSAPPGGQPADPPPAIG